MKSKISTALLILANLLVIVASLSALIKTSPIPEINLGGFIVYSFGSSLVLILLSILIRFLDKTSEENVRATIKLYLITGLIFLIFGSGPLLGSILFAKLGLTSDPNPNPIFFGMMAGFSFWPGLLFLITAFIKKIKSKNRIPDKRIHWKTRINL